MSDSNFIRTKQRLKEIEDDPSMYEWHVPYLVSTVRELMAECDGLRDELEGARDELLDAATTIREIANGLETWAAGPNACNYEFEGK